MLKRIQPAPQGRAHRIRKRSNHTTIIVDSVKKLILKMGQKTNPIGNRLGFIQGWDSNWFGGNDYAAKIVEDHKIRNTFLLVCKKLVSLKLLLNVLSN